MNTSLSKRNGEDVTDQGFVKSLKNVLSPEKLKSRMGNFTMENKSIFENDSLDKCYICGKWGKVDEHHVFGGSCRKTSDRYGFVVHLCRKCHSLIHDSEKGADMKLYLHQRGQMIYEERFGNRQAFISEFIRSYL